jgi:hypothetical protein
MVLGALPANNTTLSYPGFLKGNSKTQLNTWAVWQLNEKET